MAEATQFRFGAFRIDITDRRLRDGSQAVDLTPQAFTLLAHLVKHSGRLVTKDELMQAVWQDTVVSEDALYTLMSEVRWALKDDPHKPQFIKTEPKQGYRFTAPLTALPPETRSPLSVSSPDQAGAKIPPLATSHWSLTTPSQHVGTDTWQLPLGFVGRNDELQQLHSLLDKSLAGERQIVFLTGEPGIGKTTLARAFLKEVVAAGRAAVGRGQCIEQYGVGEAYLPVLEALGRLCRSPKGEFLLQWLWQHAPTWLLQLPSCVEPADYEVLQWQLRGTMRERMLRELLEAIEILTPQYPVVFFLEDLHWSDYSTLDLLSALARRSEQARLLIIGTYRSAERLADGHPLRALLQELCSHGQCSVLELRGLAIAEVEQYLVKRFPTSVLPTRLAEVLQQRTEGNPLFLVNLVNDLIEQNLFVKGDGGWSFQGALETIATHVPETSRQLIMKQMDRLPPQAAQTLEAASVAGAEFSAAAVAVALQADLEGIEKHCDALVRREEFLRRAGLSEWPDGTMTTRYGFRHTLYQELWHERVPTQRRRQFHLTIGERLEQAYGSRTGEIAAELALHFEQGRDYHRAVQYLQQAAQNALRRSAHKEAITHLTKGLELVTTFPQTDERAQQELTLQIALGVPLLATKGYADPEVERNYARARNLFQQVGESPQLFPVLWGLWMFYTARAEIKTALHFGEQCLRLAQRQQDTALLLAAHHALGVTYSGMGEFVLSLEHLEQALALYDSQQYRQLSFLHGQDPGVACLSHASHTLWFLGYPEQALRRSREALTLARGLDHPFSLVAALALAAWFHQLRRESALTQELAEEAVALSRERGFAYRLSQGTILRGWALAVQGQEEEGIAQIHQGLNAHRATGAEVLRPYFLGLLTEACEQGGRHEEGLHAVTEALAAEEKSGERLWESELHRLKGELFLKSKVQSPKSKVRENHASSIQSLESEAEENFLRAIAVAQRQQAKSFELRAMMSLHKLRQRQGRGKESRAALAALYNWFTEGFETADLMETKALLSTQSSLPGRRRYR
jgi:predicted ATPase/DNA-binding winged helix-turn-helix (wHTH) protein